MIQVPASSPLLRGLVALSALLLISNATCCSSSPSAFKDRKPVHPVRGQVLVNEKPARGAFVLFVPVNESAGSQDPRPHAEVTEDGNFVLATYDSADGAPSGDYLVTVQWPGGVSPDGKDEPEDKLLGRYSDSTKSGLRATVKEGPNELPPFRLK